MSIRVAQRYPGSADADEGRRSSSFTASTLARIGRSRAQLAQMFWLAVREVKLGDGVGVVAWPVPSVWVVVP
jgi:hypothetical protein